MYRKAFVSTSFCGTVSTITIDLEEATRDFLRLSVKNHHKEFPRTKSSEVVACINLTKIRVLRPDLKLKGQLQTGCFVWLVSKEEWDSFTEHLNSKSGTPTRYGRSLPYRSPASLSPQQLHDFVKCFCDYNKLNMNTDVVDEVIKKRKALLSPTAKSPASRAAHITPVKKKESSDTEQDKGTTIRKEENVDDEDRETGVHVREEGDKYQKCDVKGNRQVALSVQATPTTFQAEDSKPVVIDMGELVEKDDSTISSSLSISTAECVPNNIATIEVELSSDVPILHSDDAGEVTPIDSKTEDSNHIVDDKQQDIKAKHDEIEQSIDELTNNISGTEVGNTESISTPIATTKSSQQDASLVLKMFSDMEKLESAMTPAITNALKGELKGEFAIKKRVGDEDCSGDSPGDRKNIIKPIDEKTKLRKQEEFKREVLNLKAAIQQMKTGQNEMKTFLNEINSMNDNLNAVRDMIKLQEFQQKLQKTKSNSNNKVQVQAQKSPPPQTVANKKHATVFSGVMKSILDSPMLNSNLKASSISVSPQKKAVTKGISACFSNVKSPGTRPTSFQAQYDSEITVTASTVEIIPPPPQSYTPFHIIQNNKASPEIQRVDQVAKDEVSDATSIVLPIAAANTEDNFITNINEEDADSGEDTDSVCSDIEAPPVSLMMSPSRVHQAKLFDSSPLQNEGFEQVEARIAAEEMHGEMKGAKRDEILRNEVDDMKEETIMHTTDTMKVEVSTTLWYEKELAFEKHVGEIEEDHVKFDASKNSAEVEVEKIMRDSAPEVSNTSVGTSIVQDENLENEVVSVELKSSPVENLEETPLPLVVSAPSMLAGIFAACEEVDEEENNRDSIIEGFAVHEGSESPLDLDGESRPPLKHQLSLALQATRDSLHHVEGAPVLPALVVTYDIDEIVDDFDEDVKSFGESEEMVDNTRANDKRPKSLKHQLSKQLQATRRSLNHVEGALLLPPVDRKYSDVDDDEEVCDREYTTNANERKINSGDNSFDLEDRKGASDDDIDSNIDDSGISDNESSTLCPPSNILSSEYTEIPCLESETKLSTPTKSTASLFGVVDEGGPESRLNPPPTQNSSIEDEGDDVDEDESGDVFNTEVGPVSHNFHQETSEGHPISTNDYHKISVLIAFYRPYFFIMECPSKHISFLDTQFKASESTTCFLWAIFQCYTKNESDVISRSMKVTYLLHLLRDAGLVQNSHATGTTQTSPGGAHQRGGIMRRDSLSRKNSAPITGPFDWDMASKRSIHGTVVPTTSNRVALELERLNKLDSLTFAGEPSTATSLNSSTSTTIIKGNTNLTPTLSAEHIVSTSSNISFAVFVEIIFSLSGLCFPDFSMTYDEDCPNRMNWMHNDFLKFYFCTPPHEVPIGFLDLPSTQVLARLAHVMLVGAGGCNAFGAPAVLPSGVFASPFPKYTSQEAIRIFEESGYGNDVAAFLPSPFQEDSVFSASLESFGAKSGAGMYGLWEHNVEQMKSVYDFYAHGGATKRRESMTGNSVKTVQSAMQKSRGAIEAAAVSTSKQMDNSMLSFEKCKTILQNFQIYPKHMDLKTIQALYQYTKQWEWTWAEAKLSPATSSVSAIGKKLDGSKQARRSVRASISFLAMERDHSMDTGITGKLLNKNLLEDSSKNSIPVTAKELKKCETSTLMTFRGFIEFLTRLALFIHLNNLDHNSQARQRGNMKTRDSGNVQRMQNQLKMEMLGTAIGLLLRLMDNSTGKKIIMGASRRGSVVVKNFTYK